MAGRDRKPFRRRRLDRGEHFAAAALPRQHCAWDVAGLKPDEMGKAIPLRRTGTPDEMANMIVFFASDAASYITGETISVNGGPNIGGIPDV